MVRPTRRGAFLGADAFAAASGGAENTQACELAMPPASGAITADVVVIGAGYAGLSCARALVGEGARVVVLEARGRVGGRCMNVALPAPFDSFVVEGGAEFIGPTQTRMYQLVHELGLGTFPTYNTGRSVSHIGGRRAVYTGVAPMVGLLTSLELAGSLVKAAVISGLTPVDRPWTGFNAARLDRRTVQEWIDGNVRTADGRALLRLVVLSLVSAEPRDISLLYLAAYIRRCGGMIRLLSTDGGAQQDRIIGGSQQIANRLAAQLAPSVHLSSPVAAVEQTASGVTVSGAGFEVRAAQAVVAMAPWMTRGIRFSPDGPEIERYRSVAEGMPMGKAWKVHCVYRTPFWRADGLNGQVISDRYLPKVVFDNTPPQEGAPGVIMGFIDGDDARTAQSMTPGARRAAVVEAMTAYFGPQAADPLAYTEQNWQAEKYSQGAPVGYFGPGVLTQGGGPVLSSSVGRVHWVSTETAGKWSGYMEGAVRAGEALAARLLRD